MVIRKYELWQDESINTDCCICGNDTRDLVLDFGNYKTTICEECLDNLIEQAENCKSVYSCRHCKYKERGHYPGPIYKCTCEKSKIFNQDIGYYQLGCECFEKRKEMNNVSNN